MTRTNHETNDTELWSRLTASDNTYSSNSKWRQATQKLARITTAGALAATIFGGVLAGTPVVRAADITVDNLTDDTLANLAGDSECSLREAIEAANTNAAVDACDAGVSGDVDVITIGAGTITLVDGNLDVTDADGLVIVGAGASETSIDGDATSRIFNVTGDLTIEDMTLTNGYDTGNGGNINVSGGADLTITDSVISDGAVAVLMGGGNINVVGGGDVTITGSTVAGGDATYGGNILMAGGGDLTITSSTIDDGSSRYGGNINFDGGNLDITDSEITDGTTTTASGGNIFLSNSISTVTDSVIDGGTAATDGGNLAVFASDLTVTGSDITDGTAPNNGGGIIFTNTDDGSHTLAISGSTISGNTGSNGGGLWVYTDADTADAAVTVSLEDSTVSDNTTGGDGSGMTVYSYANVGRTGTANVTIDGSTFAGNIAGDNGAFYTDAFSDGTINVNIVNSTFSGNNSSNDGGAFYIYDAAIDIAHSTIVSNTVGTGGAGGGISNDNGTINVSHTIIAGNTDDTGADDVDGTFVGNSYNIIGDTTGSTGFDTTDTDEDFTTLGVTIDEVIWPLGNYGGPTLTHLPVAGGPAIDAGDSSGLDFDQRGLPRIVGGTVDIGSVELQEAGLTVLWEGTEVVSGTDEVDFGGTDVDNPVVETFVISNTGDYTETLGGLDIPDGFSLVGDFPEEIGMLETVPFTMQLDADVDGLFEGTLSFTSTVEADSPYGFTIMGEVWGPELMVLDGTDVVTTGTEVDLGETPLGEPVTKTLTIANTGEMTLTVDTVDVPDGYTASLTDTLPISLTLDETRDLYLILDAEAVGTYTGTVEIGSNDPSDDPYTFDVTGDVVQTIEVPTDLDVSTVNSTTLNVAWTDTSEGETGFEAEISLDGADWTEAFTTTANVESQDDTGLNPATTYYYQVRAVNSDYGQETDYTEAVSGTTSPDLRISIDMCELMGRSVECSITYGNGATLGEDGNGDAADVMLTITPPAGTTYSASSSSVDWVQSGDVYTYTLGDLDKTTSQTVTFGLNIASTVAPSTTLSLEAMIEGSAANDAEAMGSATDSDSFMVGDYEVFLPLITKQTSTASVQTESGLGRVASWVRNLIG